MDRRRESEPREAAGVGSEGNREKKKGMRAARREESEAKSARHTRGVQGQRRSARAERANQIPQKKNEGWGVFKSMKQRPLRNAIATGHPLPSDCEIRHRPHHRTTDPHTHARTPALLFPASNYPRTRASHPLFSVCFHAQPTPHTHNHISLSIPPHSIIHTHTPTPPKADIHFRRS